MFLYKPHQATFMKLDNVRLFAEVVKQGSYSKAALSLGVSKGYLSKQIKQLEAQLEKQLLVRNTRTMRLTSAGEVLFEQSKKLTRFWSDTKTLLNNNEDSIAGEVKCTAPVGLAQYSLWPILSDVMNKHNGLSICLDTGNPTHNLIADDYDFAVRICNAPPEDMVAKKIGQVKYVCCASPEFIALNNSPVTPEQLIDFPCLVLSHWREWTFHQEKLALNIQLQGKLMSSDNEVLKKACLAHKGIARLPRYMVQKELERGALISLFDNYQIETKDVYILYPQISSRPKRIKYVIDAIIDASDLI